MSATLALAMLAASGCTSIQTAPDRPAVMPPPEKVLGAAVEPPPILKLPMDNEAFRMRPITPEDPFPPVTIGPINLHAAPAADALNVLLRNAAEQGVRLPVVLDPGPTYDVPVTLSGFTGPAEKAINFVCAAANLHCVYYDGMMRISANRQYIIALPPLPELEKPDAAYDGIMATIATITGQQATLDRSLKTITLSVTQKQKQLVEQYLEHARNNRIMIVYDAYILEVTLNDTDAVGIAWQDFFATFARGPNATLSDNFNISSALSVAPALGVVNPITFSTVFINKNFNVLSLVQFLRQQGSIRTVSQPKLTVMSGSKAKLAVGGTTTYIKQTGTVASQVTTQTTVQTDTIKTGLELQVGTNWHDETIYTEVDLQLVDLISLNPTQTGDTVIQLPETVDRHVNNLVRSRPGEVILLAGLNSTRKNDQARGMPFFGKHIFLPNQDKKETRNTELVIVMRPTVIMFQPVDRTAYRGIQ